ncbi:MAG TPA: DUF5994 family protein [Mycobacterium sp.]|uniref:DUF5994 family protein n=1 Tax=Mycobacterium sp. TaxID=1785 RepID=UPI002D32727A|nr:DUF5994 family protein [Mycobacterium sp.]HZU47714.1 DUF5994 family protein [Mycobacterium sp.]
MADSAPQRLPVARLALCERAPTRGGIDGAWWPKSGDLRSELPDLVEVFGSWIGPVHRVVYDPSMWPLAPPRIIRGKTVVSVDPYRLHARDTIYLKGTHSRDAVLFVLAPSSGSSAVSQVLRTVSESTQPMSVAGLRQLLHRAGQAVDCTSTGYMP